MMEYQKYKVEDYLNDDIFLRSILEPAEDTLRYWKTQMDAGSLNASYSDAVLILSGWDKNKHVAQPEDLDALWTRVQNSISRTDKSARQLLITPSRPVKIALSILGLAAALALLLYFPIHHAFDKKGAQTVEVAPGFVMATQAQESDNVTILSKSGELSLTGNNPQIRYSDEGVLQIADDLTESVDTDRAKGIEASGSVIPQVDEQSTVIVPYGKLARLELSDSTRLWINAGTKVTYPKTFRGTTRDIFVDGEIYAEVHHEERPFVVRTKDVLVTVKGTRFNLSSYTSDDFSQVILVDGRVEVSQDSDVLALAPSQAFILSPQGKAVQTVNTDLYTSWTRGVYKFQNEPLENVLVKLARFYNITLVLPESASGVICYGSLEIKDELTSILTGLMQVASFNFVIKDGAYYIQWNEKRN